MDEQQKSIRSVLPAVNRIHNLSLKILTMCGFGALISIGVNVMTALIMVLLQRKEK